MIQCRNLAALLSLFLMVTVFQAWGRQALTLQDKARLGQACSLNNLKRYDEAVSILEPLYHRYPQHEEILMELFRAFSCSGQKDNALALLNDIQKLKSLDNARKEYIGDMLQAVQQFELAQHYYSEILEQKPSDNTVRLKLAQVLTYQWQYEPARVQYEKLLEADPANKIILLEIARVLTYLKHYEAAQARYEKLLEADPEDKTILLELARVLIYQQHYESAQVLYEKLLKIAPEDKALLLELARIWTYRNQYASAEAVYKKILEIDLADKIAALELARIYGWNQRYDESLALYSRLIQDHPQWDIPFREKARTLGWARRYEQAIREYNLAVETYPQHIALRKEMEAKSCFYRLWDSRAITAYQEWLLAEPNDMEALFDLGQVYSRQGQWENARRLYCDVLELYSAHRMAQKALERVTVDATMSRIVAGFELFEADSAGRNIDRQTIGSYLSWKHPLSERFAVTLRQDNKWHTFREFGQVYQQQLQVGLQYFARPPFWADMHYAYSLYPDENGLRNTFGSEVNYQPQDFVTLTASHQREQLLDNGRVFADKLYRDNYRLRAAYKPYDRLNLGVNYMFSRYSDDNERSAWMVDGIYFLTRYPKALKLLYRFEDYRFDSRRPDYFSPSHFYYNQAGLEWTHSLDKEQFWGADETYYTLGYIINFDMGGENSHRFYVDIHHDWNSRCSSHLRWSKTIYERREVYSENQLSFYLSLSF